MRAQRRVDALDQPILVTWMPDNVSELLARYDTQLRARLPEHAPVGAVVEHDGPFIRTHYGTNGAVEHRALSCLDRGESITRRREAFAARDEPVEWKIHAEDAAAGVAGALCATNSPGMGTSSRGRTGRCVFARLARRRFSENAKIHTGWVRLVLWTQPDG